MGRQVASADVRSSPRAISVGVKEAAITTDKYVGRSINQPESRDYLASAICTATGLRESAAEN